MFTRQSPYFWSLYFVYPFHHLTLTITSVVCLNAIRLLSPGHISFSFSFLILPPFPRSQRSPITFVWTLWSCPDKSAIRLDNADASRNLSLFGLDTDRKTWHSITTIQINSATSTRQECEKNKFTYCVGRLLTSHLCICHRWKTESVQDTYIYRMCYQKHEIGHDGFF